MVIAILDVASFPKLFKKKIYKHEEEETDILTDTNNQKEKDFRIPDPLSAIVWLETDTRKVLRC